MERQNRLITFLSVALLALVALVVLGKDPAKKAGEDDDHEPPSEKVWEGQKDDLERLALRNESGEIVFEKKDGAWTMTAPKPLPVEDRKVTEVVERFAALEVQERELTGDLATYGLDAAQRAEVELRGKDGKSLVVYVGKDAPVGFRTYVALAPEGPALLASTQVHDLAARKADDFRSNVAWKASAGTAKRVRIQEGDRAVVLRKDDHGWWLGDEGPRASEEAVQDWLAKAEALRVVEFLDDADPAHLGLATPTTTITVEDEGGTHELRLGARAGEGVAAQGDGGPVRLGLDAAELAKLDGWTDTKLIPVRKWQVDGVEVQLGDRTGRYTRKEGVWTDAAGKEVQVDPLLEAMAGAAADRSAPGVAAPASTWGRVSLAEGETRKEAVVLGPPGPDGAHAAKDEAGGPPFLVPAATVQALGAALPQ